MSGQGMTCGWLQGRRLPPQLAALPPTTRTAVVSTAVKARGLLLALCSLTGDVFPKQDVAGVQDGWVD